MVTSLKHLGRVLTASYDYWAEVLGKLWKAWKRWSHMARIMGREAVRPRVSGMFFQGGGADGGAGGTTVWVRDVVDDPPHGQGPGEFSSQSQQADYGKIADVTGR